MPALLEAVHLAIEESPIRRFALTGSSARKLRRGGVDRGAGRAVLRTLHPFMAAELGAAFSLDRALQTGLVPLIWASAAPADTQRSHAALYLREEVQAEGLVRNVGRFARFLEALSFAHGNVLVTTSVAQDGRVERKVVEGYLGVVEDLLLAFRVPVFTRRAKRATTAHPKLYLFDAGVFRSLRPTGPLDRPSEIEGAALEGLVAQHLRAWVGYRSGDESLFFWRTRGGTEVDFVVYGGQTFAAIEVKNAREVRPGDLTGLKTFRSDYPEAHVALLYRGPEPFVRDGIPCIPVDRFLRALHPARALEAALGVG